MRDDETPATLSEMIWSVSRRLRYESRDALAPWGISPSQLRALWTLMRLGPVRPSELAGRLGIAPRSATEVVDALEERDLVRRDVDPGDRRATLVAVTDHGREVAGAIQMVRASEADRFFDDLDPADRVELERILRILTARPLPARTADR